MLYPRLIEVSGRCPPEDCGGPWGYAQLLEAIKDPTHERHAELTERIGNDFDPDVDEPELLTMKVEALATEMVTQTRKVSAPNAANPRPSPEGYPAPTDRRRAADGRARH